MELAIDLATPDATETDVSLRDRNGTAVMLSQDDETAHLFLSGRGFAGSAWLDADAAEALGNSMLLCAAQMREQA